MGDGSNYWSWDWLRPSPTEDVQYSNNQQQSLCAYVWKTKNWLFRATDRDRTIVQSKIYVISAGFVVWDPDAN